MKKSICETAVMISLFNTAVVATPIDEVSPISPGFSWQGLGYMHTSSVQDTVGAATSYLRERCGHPEGRSVRLQQQQMRFTSWVTTMPKQQQHCCAAACRVPESFGCYVHTKTLQVLPRLQHSADRILWFDYTLTAAPQCS